MPDPQPQDPKPIPREFHSEYEERPFRACSRCGEALSAFSHYQINKAWRNGECVFEYVFCEVCRDNMLEEFSDESKANLLRHQEEHLQDTHGTGQCAFCGRDREQSPMRDFVITALCTGDRMLDSLMICEPCQLETHELLSEKTRDVRRRFFEELPGVPPDWEGLPIQEDAPERASTTAARSRPVPAQSPHARLRNKGPAHDPAALFACVEFLWAKSRATQLPPHRAPHPHVAR